MRVRLVLLSLLSVSLVSSRAWTIDPAKAERRAQLQEATTFPLPVPAPYEGPPTNVAQLVECLDGYGRYHIELQDSELAIYSASSSEYDPILTDCVFSLGIDDAVVFLDLDNDQMERRFPFTGQYVTLAPNVSPRFCPMVPGALAQHQGPPSNVSRLVD